MIPMAKQPKVPFNCLLPASTVEAIKKQADADECSQADVVHRAIALLAFGDELAESGPQLATEAQLKRIKTNVTPRENVVRPVRGIREKGDNTR